MPALSRARSLLRNWFRRRHVDRELEAEVNACLDQLIAEKQAAGLSPTEALRAARLELGGVPQVVEQVREVRAGSTAETVWQDIRYGMRGLRRSPAFTAVAVLTLALGIGATAAIFSLIDAALLRPLPGDRPDELVAIYTSDYSGPLYGGSSYPDYVDFRDGNELLAGLVAYRPTPLSLGADGPGAPSAASKRVFGEIVSGSYFSMLGVRPRPGRGFLPDEDRTPGTHPVVVLSHGLWQRRFAGDPTVIGRSVRLNGHPFTVVGVAPRGFSGLLRGFAADLWVPMMMQGQAVPGSEDLTERGARGLLVMGRLRPGVTIEQARSRFQAIAAELHRAHRDSWTDVRGRPRAITLVAESDARIFPQARGPVVAFMALFMTAVGLVLLIACASVANLLLARASARRKELAVRFALGARRARLVRQLLTESSILASLGGIAGLCLAMWGLDLLMAFKPPVPVPVALDLGVGWRVIAFTAGVTLLSTLLIGATPALAASRPDLATALKDDTGAVGAGGRRVRLRRALVVAQVTLSLVLLIGSGLFLRSLQRAGAIALGFDPRNLVAMSVDLQLQGYEEARGRDFYRQLLERVRALPGVTSASLATQLPLGLFSGTRRGITIAGHAALPGEDPEVDTATVGPDYFETLRIPIVRGRAFGKRDAPGAPGAVIVNQAFARRYWPGRDALGQHIQLGGGGDPGTPSLEVVGVAADGKYVTLGEDPRPFFYLPLDQDYASSATLVVRTASDAGAAISSVQSAVHELDPNLPVYDAKTVTDHLALSLLPARMAGAVLGIFGLVALALAALGLYGVVAYSVSQRTREIGVRLALGARRRDILHLIVGEGLRLTALGVALGLPLAAAATRLLSGLLYGVSASDPVTFAAITILLVAVALLACSLPAWRAARVEPMTALHHE
ncbi:MAG TPA: ABC transporter permease [Kofleriaceae bacterium]|nr:ABC transporter permease [Kofleriaceae bacterium]